MNKELKIKTPYGDKNWSFVKKVFDHHEDLVELVDVFVELGDCDCNRAGNTGLGLCEFCRGVKLLKIIKGES